MKAYEKFAFGDDEAHGTNALQDDTGAEKHSILKEGDSSANLFTTMKQQIVEFIYRCIWLPLSVGNGVQDNIVNIMQW